MSRPRPSRVTFVIVGLGGAGGVRVTVRMANELASRGHDVRIAVPRPPWRARLRERVRRPFTWADTIRVPVAEFTDPRDLDWRRGEVAIAVGSQLVPLVAGLDVDGLHRIAWCHGIIENQPERNRAAWSTPLPKISVSPTLTEKLEAYGGGPLLGIVPNGVDPAEYFVEAHGARDGVGLIYREHWAKDPEFTRRVIAALRTRFPGFPLHVFGFGRRPRFLGRAEYRRAPSVASARGLYNRCLVWVVTSRSEGFCLPILEAMACGAAVVSTAHVSAPGLIDHGRNGLIVPIGDERACLDAVGRLLADAATRNAYVDAGLGTVQEYTWAHAADAMEACLGESLATGAGAAGPGRQQP